MIREGGPWPTQHAVRASATSFSAQRVGGPPQAVWSCGIEADREDIECWRLFSR